MKNPRFVELRFRSGSEAWILTKDLRVMSEKPVSATSDLQARFLTQPDEG